ncbi:thymidylate kinase [Rhizodiscina lignyota]|uniref:Thymidylate kinase n=1 Tax=Rhizodiscina lignyota TaxID=1504668 RepID=A0A9P4ICB5_9PEZI|nr:thymidylate kinase [Rhizodiscina lignyota]
MTRGTLIVFEGLDKAGKSTQCQLLVESLQKAQGRNVKHLRFPDRSTPIGSMIDSYLRGQSHQEDHVIHLLFSANRWELASTIENDIKNGTDVVIDRYYYSGCVYSAAKNNPSLDLYWARQPEVGLPRPDVCLFLDISADKAAARGGYGAERYESKQMQDRVRELFAVLQNSPEKEDFVRVDAGQILEKVEADIFKAVMAVVNRITVDQPPLRKVEPW